MKTGNRKRVLACLAVTLILASTLILSAPSACALNSSFTDPGLGYLTVTTDLDVARLGDTVGINLSGKLISASTQQDTLTLSIYVATSSDAAQLITQGNLVLPADASQGTASFSVAVPQNAIVGTYIYLTILDATRRYTNVYLCQVQDPTYAELQAQVQSLQSDNNLLLYIIVAVVVIFMVALALIFRLVSKASNKAKAAPQPKASATASAELN
jgi:hypothetical protein